MSAFDQLYGSYKNEQKGFFDNPGNTEQAQPELEETQPQEAPAAQEPTTQAAPEAEAPASYTSPWLANDTPYDAKFTEPETPSEDSDDFIPDWAKGSTSAPAAEDAEPAPVESAAPAEPIPEPQSPYDEAMPEPMTEDEAFLNEMSEPEPPVALPQGAWPEENTPTPPAQEAPQWNDAWGQQEAPQMPSQPPYQVPFPDGTDMSFQGTGAPGDYPTPPPQNPMWGAAQEPMTPMQPPEIQEGWQAKKSKHKEKKPPREKRKKKNKYDDFDDDVVEKGTYDPSEVLRREIEEATDKEWKRRKRERVELTKKEKQQAARKKKMQDPSKKSGNGANAVLRVLLCAILACVLMIAGYQRIQAANSLIGSTIWDDKATPGPEIPIDDPLDDPNGKTADDTTPGTMKSYSYIDADRLDAMTPTALAVWYLSEFPENKSVNEQALNEFKDWYEKKAEEDASFSGKYDEAIAYVKDHPELLEPAKPVVKDNATNNNDQQTPTAPTNPTNPNGTATNPATPSNGGQTQPPSNGSQTNNGNQGQTGTVTPATSKYPNIPESELNTYSAAQLANWVFKTFPPDGSTWNYQALTDYYSWLDEKDADFRALVNGHLSVMGWTTG